MNRRNLRLCVLNRALSLSHLRGGERVVLAADIVALLQSINRLSPRLAEIMNSLTGQNRPMEIDLLMGVVDSGLDQLDLENGLQRG